MALDPKDLYSEGWWDEKNPLPTNITPPNGVDWATGNYYAHFRINKDGSRDIQWYQRGVGGGAGKPDPVLATTSDQLPAGSDVVKAWEAAQAKDKSDARAESGGVTREGATRGPQTNPTREVYRNGEWVTEPNPTYQADPTSPAGRTAAANATTAEIRAAQDQKDAAEIAANAALPPDQDPRAETNAQRAARAQATIHQQGVDAEAADRNQREKDAAARQAAAAAAPKPVATNTTEPYIVQTGPDGKLITTANPNYQGEKPQRSTVKGSDGKTYVVSVDKDGKASARAVEGLPADINPNAFAAEPAGAPPIDTTYGAVTASTARYRDFLNEQVQRYKKSGGTEGIPEAQATNLMAARLAQAEATVKESQGVIDTQRGIQQTAAQQRGNTLTDTAGRRSGAEGTFSTVMSQFMPLLKYLPPGSGETFVKGMQEMLGMGQHNAEVWGGLRESPEVPLGPAAAAANRAGPAPSSFLAPYQSPPPGGPNALGLGAVGAASGGPPVPPPGTLPPPMPGPPPPLGQGQDLSTPTSPAPNLLTAEPVQGQPVPPAANPNAPVGMAPQQQGTFLDAYGRPMPHPDSEVARMLNDPEMPNDIVAQAYREVFGVPMPYAA